MRIHNFPVDYREEYTDHVESVKERSIFKNDIGINGQSAIVVSDDVRARGKVSNYQKGMKNKGIKLRDGL